MDVTSLLNQSAVSVYRGSPTRETTPSSRVLTQDTLPTGSLPTPSPDRTTPQQDWDSKSSKSRKPWSAGGYALPSQTNDIFRSDSIFSFRSASENPDSESSCESSVMERHSRTGSTDSTSVDLESSRPALQPIQAQKSQHAQWEDSQLDRETPDLMSHRSSNSHSSLSSFVSWRSRSHSRISSVTTLSGIHSARQSVAELPLLERALSPCSESYQMSSPAKRKSQPLSGTRPLQHHKIDEIGFPMRSGSPSDAVLNMKGLNKPHIVEAPTSDPSTQVSRCTVSSKSHKRAASAPDFSPLPKHKSVLASPSEIMAVVEDEMSQPAARENGTYDLASQGKSGYFEGCDGLREYQNEGTGIPAPRPVHTLHSQGTPESIQFEQHIAKPSSNTLIPLDEDGEQKPICMFVDDCDTGSQLRKAISHLFGRNKTCTLKIPKMVWVYYCRKHYQRVRYRNARTYPVTQMELVETQIERLKAWSDQNQARGKGAYIKSWTLSLRKREEKRLQGSKGASEEVDDAAIVGASHIPAWIIGELGDGFDTTRMFAIAARLREEIESGALTQVPEIEFLPDIVNDEGDTDAGKPARYRRQNASIGAAKTPKRKAPEFEAFTRQSPMYGDVGYGGHHHSDDEGIVSPSGKRPRTARAATFPHYQSADLHGTYISEPSHPYSLSAQCGFSAQEPAGHPPRARNIVPKMQYNHNTYHAVGHHDHVHHAAHGHARMSSYQGPQEGPYVQDPYNQYHIPSGYGNQPGLYPISRSNPHSPPTLPSITSRMQGGSMYGHVGANRSSAAMSAHPRGPWRPMHQRSASAYTPGSRFVPMASRPLSSGDGTPVDHGRFEGEGRGLPPPPPLPPTAHHPARHGAEVYGKHEWASEYGHPATGAQYTRTKYEH